MSEVQNPPRQADEATGDEGSLDQAAAAFAAQEAPTEQDEDAPADEPKDDSDAEPENDGEPEEEVEPEEQLAEVEFEGKTYKVAPELEKALLRQADYSRKMNEVGAKEKAYTQRLETIDGLEQIAEKRAESLATLKTLDAQIEAFKDIDWAKARSENPGQAALAAVELMALQQQRAQALQASEQASEQFKTDKAKLDADQRAEMAKVLDKELPDWRGKGGEKLTEYAKEQGFDFKEIQAITDPKLIVALDKARRYDEMQKGKADIKAKAKDAPPVLKPGAPRKVNASDDAMSRLRKSNHVDDAAAAFLSRMR